MCEEGPRTHALRWNPGDGCCRAQAGAGGSSEAIPSSEQGLGTTCSPEPLGSLETLQKSSHGCLCPHHACQPRGVDGC